MMGSNVGYDRQTTLRTAEEARRRGRTRKAIASYERILAMDPADASIHGKLAPLLARRGRLEAARESFLIAARDLSRRGFLDRALGLYRAAARYLPREPSLWRSMADLHLVRERRGDAVAVLLEGAQHLRRRKHRPFAVELLRRAVEIDPDHLEASLVLARMLCRTGQKTEARLLLEGLAGRSAGRRLRKVRSALFWLYPSLATFWRWLRAGQAALPSAQGPAVRPRLP